MGHPQQAQGQQERMQNVEDDVDRSNGGIKTHQGMC
jgi:hypothetical protein